MGSFAGRVHILRVNDPVEVGICSEHVLVQHTCSSIHISMHHYGAVDAIFYSPSFGCAGTSKHKTCARKLGFRAPTNLIPFSVGVDVYVYV